MTKIFYKIFRKKPISNYPKKYKKLLLNISYQLRKKNYTINKIDKNIKAKEIFLASKTLNVSPTINWKTSFIDYEDYEALHRFRWIRDFLSNKDELSTNDVEFTLSVINSWVNNNAINPDFSDLSWCPHTVSERIVNILIFKALYENSKLDFDNIDALMNNSVKYLMANLEYFPYGYGNHLINNIRALLIYSFIYNNQKLTSLAFELLQDVLNNFVNDEYTLDYSSHYQILLFYWLYDISFFAKKYSQSDIMLYIDKYLRMLKASSRVFYSSKDQMIFVGDISPDYKPTYISSLILEKNIEESNPINMYRKFKSVEKNTI